MKKVICKCGHVAQVHGCGQTLRCMPCMTKGHYCAKYRPLKRPAKKEEKR